MVRERGKGMGSERKRELEIGMTGKNRVHKECQAIETITKKKCILNRTQPELPDTAETK